MVPLPPPMPPAPVPLDDVMRRISIARIESRCCWSRCLSALPSLFCKAVPSFNTESRTLLRTLASFVAWLTPLLPPMPPLPPVPVLVDPDPMKSRVKIDFGS